MSKPISDASIERSAKYLLESHAIHARIGRRRLTYAELEAMGYERNKTLDFEDMRKALAEIEKLASDARVPAMNLHGKFELGKMQPYWRVDDHVRAAYDHLTQAVVEMRLADNVLRNEMPDRGLSKYDLQRSAVRLAIAKLPPDAKASEVLPVAEAIIMRAELEVPDRRTMRNWFNNERKAENGKPDA